MTSRCLKYHFSLSLLLPKGLCSLCSGTRKVDFEVPFSQKDERMFSIASWGSSCSLYKQERRTTGASGSLILLGFKFLLSVLCKLVTSAWTVVSGLDVLGVSESLYTGYPRG